MDLLPNVKKAFDAKKTCKPALYVSASIKACRWLTLSRSNSPKSCTRHDGDAPFARWPLGCTQDGTEPNEGRVGRVQARGRAGELRRFGGTGSNSCEDLVVEAGPLRFRRRTWIRYWMRGTRVPRSGRRLGVCYERIYWVGWVWESRRCCNMNRPVQMARLRFNHV
jgi:hypothetical protein